MEKTKKKAILKEIACYAGLGAVTLFVCLFVVKLSVVSGNSMNDTYQDGDKLLCLRHASISRGDVIVCDSDAGKPLIKRIIAVEGDTLNIDYETGTVTLNGKELDEPYIKEKIAPSDQYESAFVYPITVPEGCYFVMGDNRNASSDSRDARVGYIKEEQIQGKVIWEIPF